MESQTELLMTRPRSEKRLEDVFDERVKSLVEDGFQKRFVHKSADLMLARLKHMSNGNEVVIKAYPTSLRIVQFTNHVLVHHEQLLY